MIKIVLARDPRADRRFDFYVAGHRVGSVRVDAGVAELLHEAFGAGGLVVVDVTQESELPIKDEEIV